MLGALISVSTHQLPVGSGDGPSRNPRHLLPDHRAPAVAAMERSSLPPCTSSASACAPLYWPTAPPQPRPISPGDSLGRRSDGSLGRPRAHRRIRLTGLLRRRFRGAFGVGPDASRAGPSSSSRGDGRVYVHQRSVDRLSGGAWVGPGHLGVGEHAPPARRKGGKTGCPQQRGRIRTRTPAGGSLPARSFRAVAPAGPQS
jgi:hypothetical protein